MIRPIDRVHLPPHNGVRTVTSIRRLAWQAGWTCGWIPNGGSAWRRWPGTLGIPISDVIRSLIDEAYEGILRERRRKAVDHLVSLGVEDPPDPQALCQ